MIAFLKSKPVSWKAVSSFVSNSYKCSVKWFDGFIFTTLSFFLSQLLILEDFQSNTSQYLNMVASLYSDNVMILLNYLK